MFFAKRKTILSIVALGLFAMSALPASAATTHARKMTGDFAIQCSGDVCMQTASKNATYATIHAWANTTTFFGHFQLWNTGCGNTIANSPDKTWPAGGTHWTSPSFVYDPACGDNWAVTGWKKVGSGYTSVGTVGFSV